MKIFRIILYGVIIFLLFLVPLQRVEIANLKPVEGIWIYKASESVAIETDTGDLGLGRTIEDAVEDIKRNSTGIIYLDTAKFVFVDETASDELIAFRPFVKGNVCISKWDGKGNVSDAVQYADAHKVGVKYKKWNLGSNLPEIDLVFREK